MYAVIKTGGKQQRVKTGDVIEVEKIVADDETLTFHPLLLVEDDGTVHAGPDAASAEVIATPLGEKKGDKVKVFKYRPKSGYARHAGHRQLLTLLEIKEIKVGTKRPAKKRTAAAKAEPEAEAPAETPAEDAE
jgi:large subunit ribosomal protein L21